MVSVTNRFPLWGDVGEEPQDGFLYEGGDQVNEKHLNYLWDKIQKQTDDFITKTDDLQSQIDGIDANGDGIVDEADTANLYKGQDIDTNGDGRVNAADDSDRYDGLAPTDGTDGQFLQTNGTTTSWGEVATGITKTEEVSSFTEANVTISGFTNVVDGSIDTYKNYNISTATFSTLFDVSGQDTNSQGMAWNDTGSKMYMVGYASDNINEYDVSTPYDISTATFSTSFNVGAQDAVPTGMAWNDTGSKMYMVGNGNDNIYEYDVSTPYDISTATFSVSFDISAQDTGPTGMAWNDTGSKMYMVGIVNNNIYEYDVSTPYDISTATFSVSFDISAQDTSPQGMVWNDTGSKMYMIGTGSDNIYEYDVSTPYDISTATFSVSFDISAQDTNPTDMMWNDTGSKMYLLGNNNNTIYEYDVGTTDPTSVVTIDAINDVYEWDIATAQKTDNGGSVTIEAGVQPSLRTSFDISGEDTNSLGMAWNNDGSKMYMVGSNNDNINEYNVSTPYDISTATFSTSFDVSTQDTFPTGIAWNDTGSKMYMIGTGNDNINEYNVSTPYDISTATFSVSFDISAQDTNPTGITWNNDGSKMYMVGWDSDNINEYDVSTAYDISTATFSTSFDVSEQDSRTEGMAWNDTGSKMYIVGRGSGSIYKYDVSTPYDISTATFSVSFDISGEDTQPNGMAWNDTGSKMYIVGAGGDNIYEYDTTNYGLVGNRQTVDRNSDISAISPDKNPVFVLSFDTSTGYPTVDFLARRAKR